MWAFGTGALLIANYLVQRHLPGEITSDDRSVSIPV